MEKNITKKGIFIWEKVKFSFIEFRKSCLKN